VFPHFRDLAHQQASLKDYFADEQVQAYLEALPTQEATNELTGATTVAHPRLSDRSKATIRLVPNPVPPVCVNGVDEIRQGVSKPLPTKCCWRRGACDFITCYGSFEQSITSPDATDLTKVQISRNGQGDDHEVSLPAAWVS